MISGLIDRLVRLAHPLQMSHQLIEKIKSKAEILEYPARSFLLKKGQVCKGAFFLVKGLARSYYLIRGKEITSRLMDESFIITSWLSYYSQTPGNESIIALEDCTTIFMHYKDIQKMYEEFPVFNRIGRRQVEYSFYNAELCTQMLRWHTAEERYCHFCERHPSLITRVPLKYIASYLGMSEVTLSRVRSKFHNIKTPGQEIA